jgi:hypothetical protein
MIKIFDGKKESAYLMRKTADINILGKCAGAGEGAGAGAGTGGSGCGAGSTSTTYAINKTAEELISNGQLFD